MTVAEQLLLDFSQTVPERNDTSPDPALYPMLDLIEMQRFFGVNGDGFWDQVIKSLGSVDSAEKRIEIAMQRHPGPWPKWKRHMLGIVNDRRYSRGPIWTGFTYLRPSPMFCSEMDEMHVAHCDELLDRIATFEKEVDYTAINREEKLLNYLSPATTPELMGGFVEASLITPLNNLGTVCYYKLFAEIFPAKAAEYWKHKPYESWEGQADEEIRRLKNKYKMCRKENTPLNGAW